METSLIKKAHPREAICSVRNTEGSSAERTRKEEKFTLRRNGAKWRNQLAKKRRFQPCLKDLGPLILSQVETDELRWNRALVGTDKKMM